MTITGILTSIITPALNFVRDNLYKIIVAVSVAAATILAFNITIVSLRKLKFEILPYYPFDRFSPQSGKWSVLYFLVVVLFFGALAYFLIKGNFNFGPA